MNINLPMKTLLFQITILFVLFGNVKKIQAQETDSIIPIQEDPEKILRKIDISEITQHGFNFWQDDFIGHWAGVDFGFNFFLNKDYSGYETEFMNNDVFRSNSTYINFIQQSIGLQHNRNTIGLVTGLGLHLQSYRLDQNTTIIRGDNDKIESETLYFDQNQKSKLSIVSVLMPLLAEFQIPINHYENRLYLSTGLYASYRMNSHTKIKYRVEGKKEKLKVPGHYHLQNFKYGLMARVGYRGINLFATYEFLPLFKENKGPELTPFTFGFTIISF
ncbi:outer membrane beta-barrel protein [Maribellus comscasis]|uniref:Outer membrane beta-barrel protein n=1 Tax=Maribellus comscasis TaxID=2681766 RepID=A0A6I6JW44_9BACT|nr:outer membrane beta-barrel protein [Maribellus comscasis]QGY44362.1 outer membrane beta-barrel protein [Maribellus comscasis]